MNIRNAEPVILKKGARQALLLFHGFSDEPETLRPLAEFLFHHLDIDIFIPLLEGHGGTMEEFRDASFHSWEDQACSVTRELLHDYEAVSVGGFSMGSLLAIETAASFPGIRTCLLLAPPLVFPPARSILLELLPLIRIFKTYKDKSLDPEGGNKHILDEKQRCLYLPRFQKEPLSAIRQYDLLRRRAKRKIKYVKSPVLAVFSLRDRVAVIKNRLFLIKKVRDIPLMTLTVTQSGHMLPVDRDRHKLFLVVHDFLKGGDDERLSSL